MSPRPADPGTAGLDPVGVRAVLDRIDRRLVILLALRLKVADAMAAFKSPGTVRDPARIAAVIAHVRQLAETVDLSPDLIEALWLQLMEASAVRQARLVALHRNAGDAAAGLPTHQNSQP
ncbi:chorismate mutase [Pseudomonas sp. ODNR1LW]|nr:chorismate mutase [Pseudomonas sp. ODNR1LW]